MSAIEFPEQVGAAASGCSPALGFRQARLMLCLHRSALWQAAPVLASAGGFRQAGPIARDASGCWRGTATCPGALPRSCVRASSSTRSGSTDARLRGARMRCSRRPAGVCQGRRAAPAPRTRRASYRSERAAARLPPKRVEAESRRSAAAQHRRDHRMPQKNASRCAGFACRALESQSESAVKRKR